ncbi:MAG: exodeoxyribonuclease VII small subunit [Burkholderiales bacterium]|nr:exodeoxyribonuclease VII small subunit [Burkholderiales bacterium]
MARSTSAASKEAPNEGAGEPASYEQALSELDRLVEQMEQGQLPLDRLLDDYKRGAELLAYCRSKLESVEAQVKLLEEGRLKPWSGA